MLHASCWPFASILILSIKRTSADPDPGHAMNDLTGPMARLASLPWSIIDTMVTGHGRSRSLLTGMTGDCWDLNQGRGVVVHDPSYF